MVLHCCNCAVRNCRTKGNNKMERKGILTDYAKGFIFGFLIPSIIILIVCIFFYVRDINKEKLKNANERIEVIEKQIEVYELQEDYRTRSVDEFLDIPDVRRAADGASAEFERKRDEILQRFRSRITD